MEGICGVFRSDLFWTAAAAIGTILTALFAAFAAGFAVWDRFRAERKVLEIEAAALAPMLTYVEAIAMQAEKILAFTQDREHFAKYEMKPGLERKMTIWLANEITDRRDRFEAMHSVSAIKLVSLADAIDRWKRDLAAYISRISDEDRPFIALGVVGLEVSCRSVLDAARSAEKSIRVVARSGDSESQ